MAWTQSWSSASSTTRHMTRPSSSVAAPASVRSLRYAIAVSKRWWPSASTSGADPTTRRISATVAASVIGRSACAHAEVVGGLRDRLAARDGQAGRRA